MTTTIFPSIDSNNALVALNGGGLLTGLQKNGRFPPITLIVKPLSGIGSFTNGLPNIASALNVTAVPITNFLSYTFTSSIVNPCDSFEFTFQSGEGPPVNEVLHEGDIVVIQANGVTIGTGVIDTIDVETQSDFGEKVSIHGRDLMGQLEDQDAINFDSSCIWANAGTVDTHIHQLCAETRITNIDTSTAPGGSDWLLATEPGESKLSAMQRFIEPLNCLAWMRPNGTLVVGKPQMGNQFIGQLVLSKKRRYSNVLSMKVSRSSTSIPNFIVPIWSGQEKTVDRVAPEQGVRNAAAGPARLLSLGHRVCKSVVVSVPTAGNSQNLDFVNAINAAAQGGQSLGAAAGNLLQAYAKREICRRNVGEIDIQAVVPGHYDENGNPYQTDTIYHVEYDRGSVQENMYLYYVQHQLTEDGGQRTNLGLCRVGALVADVKAPGQ